MSSGWKRHVKTQNLMRTSSCKGAVGYNESDTTKLTGRSDSTKREESETGPTPLAIQKSLIKKRAFFWCWWSWIIAIIQGKKRKKEKEKGKEGGKKLSVTCGARHGCRVGAVRVHPWRVHRGRATRLWRFHGGRRHREKKKTWQNDKTRSRCVWWRKNIEVVEGVNHPRRKTLSDCLVQVLMFGWIHNTVSRTMIQTWEVEWRRSSTSNLCHHYSLCRNPNDFR